MLEGLKAVRRARRAGLLRLRPASQEMRLECPPGVCGLCCSTMGGGVVVTPSEAQFLPPQSLAVERKVIVLKSEQGECAQLHNAACGCYSVRPRGCREYPWYSVNAKLYYDSGCPGVKFDRDDHPPADKLADIAAYLPFRSTKLNSLLVWLLRRW